MSLFQTKAWQSAWWDTWGRQKSFRLVRPWDGEVSGLYESRYRLKGVLPIRSLQFVGTSSRELRTPRTEYNRFSRNLTGQPLVRALQQQLESHTWTEAVFNDLRAGSEDLSALVTIAATQNWAFRIIAVDDGYAVTTSGPFDEYLASLGANSRLKLYNRRAVLESLGPVREENLWPHNSKAFFDALNAFHRERWRKDCVAGKSLTFHERFLSRVEEEGGRPLLSTLTCGNHIVSVLYNVWYRESSTISRPALSRIFIKSCHLDHCIWGMPSKTRSGCPTRTVSICSRGKARKKTIKRGSQLKTISF